MKTKQLFLLIAITVLTAISTVSYSQDKQQSHLYEMNFITLNYEQMEDFMQLYENYGKPMDMQNEFILSTKILRHVSGPSWNICFITEYKDLEAFAKSQKRGDEIFEKMYPDKSKQEEIMKKWSGYLRGHTDALVRDNPGLEKSK